MKPIKSQKFVGATYKTLSSGNDKAWLFLELKVYKIVNGLAFLWENPKLGSGNSLQRKTEQKQEMQKWILWRSRCVGRR